MRPTSKLLAIVALLAVTALAACYSVRGNSSGAQAQFEPPRRVDARDVALPRGYAIEAIVQGLTFPTGVAWDAQGRLHVVESGYSYGEVWTTPRLLRVEDDGRTVEIARGGRNGPWNGVAFADGAFYVAEGGALDGGRLLRIDPDGALTTLVENLPSRGDHHTNGPAIGPDGAIYIGQGTATNSGVVGEDNAKFGWLARAPGVHDIPGADIQLKGATFESADPKSGKRVRTSAFAPFGERATTVSGSATCNGSILRVSASGGAPELVAWGFRNPFGLAFAPDGRLYATDNGYDDRGSRPVWGAPDLLWRVEEGVWHGWPDFSGGISLSDKQFKPPGKRRPQPLLAQHPNPPPKPVALLDVHCSANGLDFSRSDRFGHVGQAFVALFGDQAPATGKLLAPVGFKVVRVDVSNGDIEEFATNRGAKNGPASLANGGGFERPIAVRFDPSGDELVVVDFGVLLEEESGSRPFVGTGVLWRIRRVEEGAP